MHPEDIKAAIRITGWTQAAIARALDVTQPAVSGVIHGNNRSLLVQTCISALIEQPIEVIWPDQPPVSEEAFRKTVNALHEMAIAQGI